jgi:hypothetical protein
MTNRRVVAMSCLSLVLLASRGFCQNTVVLEGTVLTSRSLSGHVQLGANESGLRGLQINICDSKWIKVLASTTSDEDGMFNFPSRRRGLYHLRLSLPGANTLLVKVKLASKGPNRLSLTLTPAT